MFCDALRIAHSNIIRGSGNKQVLVECRTKIADVALNTVS